ncbi:MAG TPA: hypothetical protein VLC09_00800 [Polyangiaceae bacterium]|nr:hypothetical protein [Polyangiaceae bacterium]
MSSVIEPAPSGRARCRSCKGVLEKGALRFGAAVPNAFGSGEARHWYHLDCGAERRPEAFLEALDAAAEPPPAADELRRRAAIGIEHPRWTRVVKVERASSGRARCRHCKETVDKDQLRLVLEYIEDGMANAAGFVHPTCMREYAGTVEGLIERVERAGPLSAEDRAELEAAWA